METENSSLVRHVNDSIMIVVFAAAIGLPLLSGLLGIEQDASPIELLENRRPTPRPELPATWAGLQAFPRTFEAHYDDSFDFRLRLIRGYNRAKVNWLGTSPSPKVVIGKDGWLFLAEGEALDDFRNLRPFRETRLLELKRMLEQRHAWLARRGIRYLYVVVPDKHTIYPEFVPDRFNRVGERSRLDQLIGTLGADPKLEILDLRKGLTRAKGRAPTYRKTGTHWNEWGAFIGYSQIAGRLSRWFPHVVPKTADDFEMGGTSGSGDLALMMGMWGELAETVPVLEWNFSACSRTEAGSLEIPPSWRLTQEAFSTTCEETGLPRAVMFGDSFARGLVSLLSEHFARITYVWGSFDRDLTAEILGREPIDVVIEEIVERNIQ